MKIISEYSKAEITNKIQYGLPYINKAAFIYSKGGKLPLKKSHTTF